MIFILPLIAMLFSGSYAALKSIYPSEACFKDCRASSVGKALVEQLEGTRFTSYADVGGKETICTGHLIKKGEHFDEPLTLDECETLLENDLKPAESGVNRGVRREVKQNQADAIISLFFNTGAGKKEQFLARVNANKDPKFELFNKVNGKPVKGLTTRRKAEASLYAM